MVAWWPVAMNLNRIAQAAAVVALVGSLSACPADTDSENPTDDVATTEAPAEETDAPLDEETDDSLEEDLGEDTDAPADEDTDAPTDEETPAEEDLQ
jgi:hypothetical protein